MVMLRRWTVRGRMVMLQMWSLMKGEWSMLQMGEWSCYGGRQFKGGRIIVTVVAGLMVKLQRWSV